MRAIRFRAWDVANLPAPSMKYYELGDRIPDVTKCPVMQFTGLLDRDGRELYEGDIVRPPADGHLPQRLYVVRWNKARAAFEMSFPNGLATSLPEDAEVVGNIYEHGHLLKTEKSQRPATPVRNVLASLPTLTFE